MDEQNNALSFVNIGVPKRGAGTVSDTNGMFHLSIPTAQETDTLMFSMAGYAPLRISIAAAKKESSFTLRRKPADLKAVTISRGKLTRKDFGKGNSLSLLQFSDGSIPQNDIFEIGKFFKLNSTAIKITSVSLYINESQSDSGTFRINFYRHDGHGPAERLTEQSIIQKKAIKEGWLQFDLSDYDVRLKGAFVAAIEFLPTRAESTSIYYGIKPGGTGSFVRKSSQGEWMAPPHRYRMFVTALVPTNRSYIHSLHNDEEAVPAFRMYSSKVADSFSIFVRLPPKYGHRKGKKYPVAYLLDANYYFDALGQALQKENLKDFILVGVGYKDFLEMDSLRCRDYTYPKASPKDSFLISGGGDKFLSFLQEELVPLIDNKYKVDTNNRALLGHSLGGYFALYTLQQAAKTNKAVFKDYIAASPTLGHCENYLPNRYKEISETKKLDVNSLFITLGSLEDEEDNTGNEQRNLFEQFTQQILKTKSRAFNMKQKIYPDSRHMQTALPSFLEGLRYLY